MSSDASEASDPLLGRIIGERYRVLAPIGRGGMGAVYRVEHMMMKKEMALKLLHPELSRLEEIGKRFEREAEAAAKLDHPNIIHVTDFGRTQDGLLFLVMELLHGQSLTDVIRPDGVGRPLPAARAIFILRQILRALEHAHAVGIVHRDLKPDNVMLGERDGEKDIVKLLDFGIAKMTGADAAAAAKGTPKPETLTQAGVVFGTPEYLSPEQALGEEADQRADLYSAGVVLYEMLTGRRPFEAASKVAIVSMHLTQKAMPVTQAAPDAEIPLWLERVVERAMIKQRDQRFATAQEFLQALDGSGSGASRRIAVITPSGGLADATRGLRARLSSLWEFLVRRAREAGVPFPRAFIIAGLTLVAMLVILLSVARKPERPRPAAPPPQLTDSLARVEQMLSRGELEPARAALQQLESAHPEAARVHYLLGNLDYAQGDRERALADYHDAIHLDSGYAGDAVLRGNVHALLERRNESGAAIALLADDIGKAALPELVACAKNCRDDRTRKKAADAAVKLGGPALAEKEGQPHGDADDLLEKLRSGRTCRDRKAAALELIGAGDPRVLDDLRAARDRRGGFLGIQGANGCMRRELDAAIRKWEAEK